MYRFAVSVLLIAVPAPAAEADALAISANIQARHQPFGTILDPFLDPNGNVTGYVPQTVIYTQGVGSNTGALSKLTFGSWLLGIVNRTFGGALGDGL
ncbi:MAG: hypothetical protein JNL62_11855, partial [Bryobacterales bacterium]|nr:hypothetical protein [Bryobacterales bacterium]